ncbi:MAG: S1 RNA-binding domain-containing protein [Candidatus Pristimantibacillus sp.]
MSTLTEEQNTPKAEVWRELRTSRTRTRVLFAQVVGLEDLSLAGQSMKCLKLDYKGIYGYMPSNKIDNYEFKNLQHLMGSNFEFVVDEVITPRQHNEAEPHEELEVEYFLANRIKALEVMSELFWKQVEVDQRYTAFIKGIDAFRLYLLVEGVEIVLDRTEVDYNLYDDLRTVFEIGQTIDVKVMKVEKPTEEKPKGDVSVSAKVLMEDPWRFIKDFKERGTYLGTLQRIHPEFGMFVELKPGLTVKCNVPAGASRRPFKRGDEINVKIRHIDHVNHKILGTAINLNNSIGANNKNMSRSGLRWSAKY